MYIFLQVYYASKSRYLLDFVSKITDKACNYFIDRVVFYWHLKKTMLVKVPVLEKYTILLINKRGLNNERSSRKSKKNRC